jgi:hypothetical protein
VDDDTEVPRWCVGTVASDAATGATAAAVAPAVATLVLAGGGAAGRTAEPPPLVRSVGIGDGGRESVLGRVASTGDASCRPLPSAHSTAGVVRAGVAAAVDAVPAGHALAVGESYTSGAWSLISRRASRNI